MLSLHHLHYLLYNLILFLFLIKFTTYELLQYSAMFAAVIAIDAAQLTGCVPPVTIGHLASHS